MALITKNEYGLIVRKLEHSSNFLQYIGVTNYSEQLNTESITYNFTPPQFAEQISWYSIFVDVVETAIEEKIIKNAIVHGSYGDNTTTPFSDLEITLIIEDNLFSNYVKIKRMRHWLQKKLYPLILQIDPLQHHGAFYLWKQLIHHYNESILPLSAYDNSWAVHPQKITFYRQDTLDISHNSFSKTLQSLRNHQKNFFRYGMNPYSIKRMLSNIMLVPAFYYQQHGTMMMKPEAIKQIKDDNPIAGEMMVRASAFRREWKKPPAWLGHIRSIINQGYIPSTKWDVLLTNLHQDRELNAKFQKEILSNITRFCDSFEMIL